MPRTCCNIAKPAVCHKTRPFFYITTLQEARGVLCTLFSFFLFHLFLGPPTRLPPSRCSLGTRFAKSCSASPFASSHIRSNSSYEWLLATDPAPAYYKPDQDLPASCALCLRRFLSATCYLAPAISDENVEGKLEKGKGSRTHLPGNAINAAAPCFYSLGTLFCLGERQYSPCEMRRVLLFVLIFLAQFGKRDTEHNWRKAGMEQRG